jgi:putative oxidoreductase
MPAFLSIQDLEEAMFITLGQLAERAANSTIFLGRVLLAALFIHESLGLALRLTATLAAMGKLGVPAPLGIAAILLQLIAGLAMLLGWQTRLAAVGLGLFCIATAMLFHTNFAIRNELLHFEKDLAIAGGMFTLAVHGAGTWSLDHVKNR